MREKERENLVYDVSNCNGLGLWTIGTFIPIRTALWPWIQGCPLELMTYDSKFGRYNPRWVNNY